MHAWTDKSLDSGPQAHNHPLAGMPEKVLQTSSPDLKLDTFLFNLESVV